jgi:hypothetical protein
MDPMLATSEGNMYVEYTVLLIIDRDTNLGVLLKP